jgi:DNA-binding transcriptional regulator YiaG
MSLARSHRQAHLHMLNILPFHWTLNHSSDMLNNKLKCFRLLAKMLLCTKQFPAMLLEKLVKSLKGEVKMKQHTSKAKIVKPHGLPHLRILRQRQGLSIGQLASMTGIRRDTISHLESGREDPQPYQLRLLARVLEVPQYALVS